MRRRPEQQEREQPRERGELREDDPRGGDRLVEAREIERERERREPTFAHDLEIERGVVGRGHELVRRQQPQSVHRDDAIARRETGEVGAGARHHAGDDCAGGRDILDVPVS